MKARDLQPLPSAVSIDDDAVLFFDSHASANALFEEGMHRFETAHNLADMLACSNITNTSHDAVTVFAEALTLLTADAKAFLYAMDRARRRELTEQAVCSGEATTTDQGFTFADLSELMLDRELRKRETAAKRKPKSKAKRAKRGGK